MFDRWDEAQRIRYGYGMTGRADLALRWYEKAARQGDARAMHNVGLMLDRGQGTAADRPTGRDWLTRAFVLGLSESALALGNIARTETSYTSQPGPARAAAYYRRGAAQGDARAMHALGNLHMAGSGVPLSPGEAYFWYVLAAEKGHPAAAAARETLRGRLPFGDVGEIEDRTLRWEADRRRGR